MSNSNYSRRHRGLRFRPKGGLGHTPQKPDREATEARADAVSEQGGSERVFEKRHATEIERAENLAAGLPAEGTPAERPDSREPLPDVPAPAREKAEFRPVAIQEPSKGILDSIKNVAATLVK